MIGLNAPLYKRHNEHSILATLNINASVSFWHENGLDKNKIVVGIPTYGHSFRYITAAFFFIYWYIYIFIYQTALYSLVNPFNSKLGSPASGYGYIGQEGKHIIKYIHILLIIIYSFFRLCHIYRYMLV